jgi:PAS domain S-box-containing protein
VLVAEDERPLRDALCALISSEADLEVVAAAASADEATELAGGARADVAIVDVRMPGGGEAAVRGILERSPATHVLALSAYDDQAIVGEMLRSGAIGYLVKGVAPTEIIDAVRRAGRGQSSLSIEVLNGLVGSLAAGTGDEGRRVEELRRSEVLFRTLVEAAPDALVAATPAGTIALVNARTEQLFGYGREDLIGQPVEILLPERVRDLDVWHREDYLGEPGGRPTDTGLELVGRRRDGDEFPVDVTIASVETASGRLVTAFVRDLTERRAREELERGVADRRALLRHLVSAVEEERARIAEDIHDDSIQAITAAGMRLQILRRTIADPGALELLGELEETIQLAIARLRHLLFELRPPALEDEGLSAAVAMYLDETAGDAETRYRLDDRLTSQPAAETRTILYRIVQEALANIRKHAAAPAVTVLLREQDGGYLVRVADDGVGFVPESAPLPGHLGLASMRERVALAGGWLRVDSTPGQGTTVEVWLPASFDRPSPVGVA